MKLGFSCVRMLLMRWLHADGILDIRASGRMAVRPLARVVPAGDVQGVTLSTTHAAGPPVATLGWPPLLAAVAVMAATAVNPTTNHAHHGRFLFVGIFLTSLPSGSESHGTVIQCACNHRSPAPSPG